MVDTQKYPGIMRMRLLVGMPGFSMLAVFILSLVISACGGSQAGGSAEPGQLDSQPIVEIGGNGAEGPALTSSDLPLISGSELVFSANSTSSPVTVSFDLEGPWDFTDGPDSFTLTLENIDKSDAPSQEQFPEAAIAVKTSWEPALIEDKYSFQDIDEESWRAFGNSSEARLESFSGPSRALIFPAAVGDRWTDTYRATEDGLTKEIIAENEIVAFNSLDVPAGEFEAFLLQTKITATVNEESVTTWDYVWLVPGIGRAAEIVSRPDEGEEVFDRAYAFYRLESYNNA